MTTQTKLILTLSLLGSVLSGIYILFIAGLLMAWAFADENKKKRPKPKRRQLAYSRKMR